MEAVEGVFRTSFLGEASAKATRRGGGKTERLRVAILGRDDRGQMVAASHKKGFGSNWIPLRISHEGAEQIIYVTASGLAKRLDIPKSEVLRLSREGQLEAGLTTYQTRVIANTQAMIAQTLRTNYTSDADIEVRWERAIQLAEQERNPGTHLGLGAPDVVWGENGKLFVRAGISGDGISKQVFRAIKTNGVHSMKAKAVAQIEVKGGASMMNENSWYELFAKHPNIAPPAKRVVTAERRRRNEQLHMPLYRFSANQVKLKKDRAVHFLAGVASGLAYIHRRGYLHRDVKPANMFAGEEDLGIIGDLGEIGTEGYQGGTPKYWAPEQKRDERDDGMTMHTGATDVYAFGLSAKEILGDNIDEELQALVDQAMDEDPFKRPTMAELASRLSDIDHA
jgi:Protein kinase domain